MLQLVGEGLDEEFVTGVELRSNAQHLGHGVEEPIVGTAARLNELALQAAGGDIEIGVAAKNDEVARVVKEGREYLGEEQIADEDAVTDGLALEVAYRWFAATSRQIDTVIGGRNVQRDAPQSVGKMRGHRDQKRKLFMG